MRKTPNALGVPTWQKAICSQLRKGQCQSSEFCISCCGRMNSLSLCNWDEVQNVSIKPEETGIIYKSDTGLILNMELWGCWCCSEESHFGVKKREWKVHIGKTGGLCSMESDSKAIQRAALVPAPNYEITTLSHNYYYICKRLHIFIQVIAWRRPTSIAASQLQIHCPDTV